jgi:hypothetical protein
MCLGLTLVETRGEKNKIMSDKLTACPRLAKQQEKRYLGERVRIWPQEQNPHNIWVSTMPSRNGAREAKSPSQGTSNGNATWEIEKTAQVKEGVGNFQDFRT